jgi:hypothetical protein
LGHRPSTHERHPFCEAKATITPSHSVALLFIMAGIAQADFMITTVSELPTLTDLYGPLTAPFTYADHCLSDHWVQYFSDEEKPGIDQITNSIPIDCQPSIKVTRQHAGPIYSPGTCISGHRVLSIVEARTSGYEKGIGGCGRLIAAEGTYCVGHSKCPTLQKTHGSDMADIR